MKQYPCLILAACLSVGVTPEVGATLITFELYPSDVGSSATGKFVPAPTEDPTIFGFGLGGAKVWTVNFDVDPFGTPLTTPGPVSTQYASIGVTMNDIPISTGFFGGVNGGPATAPNQTRQGTPGPGQVATFTFTEPVTAVGIVNTSPDADIYEFLDASGNLIGSITDSADFPVNRFVGGASSNGVLIKTFRVIGNPFGGLELDDLIFQRPSITIPEPTSLALLCSGVLGFVIIRILTGFVHERRAEA